MSFSTGWRSHHWPRLSVKAIGWNEVPEGQVPCNLRCIEDYCRNKDNQTYSTFEIENKDFQDSLFAVKEELWLSKASYQGNAYAGALLNRQNSDLLPNVFLGVTGLLHHMGRIFQDNSLPQSRPGGIQIDRKRMKKLQEKRAALGQKGNVYEAYKGPSMSM